MIKKISKIIILTLIVIIPLIYIYTPNVKKIMSDNDIKENLHYKKIDLSNVNISDKNIIKNINNGVTKIFWINCPNCYEMSNILKLNNINTYYYPFSMEDSNFKIDAEMYFLLNKFSDKDEYIYKLFEYYNKEKEENKEKVVKFISTLLNKDESSLYLYLESEELKTKIKDANEISNKLNIIDVPTIIVNGNIILKDNIKDNEDIIKVINYLNKRG